MRDLRRAAEANPDYPPLLFVYQGTPDDGPGFFDRDWPAARAVADPERQLYFAFGIERGTTRQLLNPSVIACGIRATMKGHIGGRPQGDSRLMPGLFLVTADTILWHHDYRHPGDHPDFATIPARIPAFAPAD